MKMLIFIKIIKENIVIKITNKENIFINNLILMKLIIFKSFKKLYSNYKINIIENMMKMIIKYMLIKLINKKFK